MSPGSHSALRAPHMLSVSAANQGAPLAQMAVTILQGRFSGRLQTKLDEERLPTECAALGPLLGGVTDGESLNASQARARASNSSPSAAWLDAGLGHIRDVSFLLRTAASLKSGLKEYTRIRASATMTSKTTTCCVCRSRLLTAAAPIEPLLPLSCLTVKCVGPHPNVHLCI